MEPSQTNQDALRALIEARRPLTADELARFGVEFVTSVQRLAQLRDRYGIPNAHDIGQGVFGINAGLVFVDDDDDGRMVAYAPPETSRKCHEEMLDQLADQVEGDEALARQQAAEAHALMPPELAAKVPPLYANEGQGDEAIAHVKLFTPWTNWTWYASEYDPEQRLCFGVVVGHERELGYFSLAELEEIRGPGGLRIERDLHWKPRALKECQ